MSETTRPAARGAVPWGLIGMIGLVLAGERCVARHEPGLAGDTMVLGWRDSRRAAGDEAARAEVLCLGDSLVKVGVLPRVLEAGLGRPAYNLATPGATAPAAYFLLRRALDAGARPKAIVLDFDANVLGIPPRQIARYWPELVGPREALDLCATARDLGLLGSTALALALPSLKDRDEVRDTLRAALDGEPGPSRDLLAGYLHNCRRNGGATAHRPIPQPPNDPSPEGPGPPRSPRRWAPYRANAAYVRRVLDLAAAREIPVFWLLPPVSPARQAKRERNGLDEDYSRFVRAASAPYPNVVVLDARRSGYGRDLFVDPVHLDGRGASELSAAVADSLADRLAGIAADAPRWIDLPAYRGRRIDIALETWSRRGLP